MKFNMRQFPGKKFFGCFALLIAFCISAFAFPPSPIEGPENVFVGQTTEYAYEDGLIYIGQSWQVTGGSIISSNREDTYYTVIIQWNTAGAGNVSFNGFGSTIASKSVSVVACTALPAVTMASRCGTGTLVLSASGVPSGGSYRWYTVSTGGTPISGQTGPTYTTPSISSTTPYYVSIVAASGCETSRVEVMATVHPSPATPSGQPGSRFGSGSVTLTGTPGQSGNAVRWYSAASGGSVLYTGTSFVTPTLSSTIDYFASSYSTTSQCESTRVPIAANIYPNPVITSASPGFISGGVIRILSVNNYTYDTYQWLDQAGSAIAGATASSYSASLAGEYKVRVTKGGLSPVISNNVVVPTIELVGSGLNMNYIISNTIQVSNITNPNQFFALTVNQNSQAIQYFDGLGRPIQSITTQGSPNKKDILQPVMYDQFGRENKKYLPVVPGSTDGWYKDITYDANGNYTGVAGNTYANNAAGEIAQDARPFSETIFEASPLNRPVKNYGPGVAWSPTSGNKFVEQKYLINVHGTTASATAEKVIAWKVNMSTGMPMRCAAFTGYIATDGYFSSGQLFVNITVDEQGNAVREYTNKQGQVILKKVQATTAGATDLNSTTGWALTYYLYDDFGNLRYVFPPELSKLLHTNAATYVITTTDLANWAFQYKYDGRKRMIEKQVPGAGAVYMVYDDRDRLVMTQDANQRATSSKYWSFTKYDELNRPILTGIKDTVSLTQAQMQTVVNNFYAAIPTKPWRKWGEAYVGNATGNLHGYSNKSYPIVTGPTTTIDKDRYLSVTYYDNYLFRDLWVGTYTYLDENLSEPANGITYNQPDTEFTRIIGQTTGTKIKVLDGGVAGGYTWLKSVNYFDDRYRVIQSLSDNYKGGTDRLTNVYDFTGKVLKSKATHDESDVTWKDQVTTVLQGNMLINTSSSSSWVSGAASVQQLAAGQPGWLETIYTGGSAERVVGLSDVNTNAHFNTIDFGVYLGSTALTNTAIVYENGTAKYTIPGKLSLGDVVRIERAGTTITYKVNGQAKYTSLVSSSTVLMADASVNYSGCTVAGVRSSFSTTSHSTIRRFEYDHAGRLLKTWHKLDTQPEILLAKNEYNELGQLIDKKLHSTVSSGADARQSVDYRYNIRGWLTKLNESDLSINEPGDPRDFFGMELLYEQLDANISNAQLYNGNISAMKWSNQLGLGSVKENAYTYGYDPMNRISASTFKEKASSWSAPANSAFAETGFTYDLNGNIKTLQRNDKRASGWMDNLAYDYGTGTAQSNKLLKVTDTGDDFKGFLDGNPGTGTDYTYDANGNMITDQNKNITSAITYNFLNLPEKVTRNNSSVTYIYDASGRKLAQVATYATAQKQTDYAGEYVYENDALQFISHEEGRIMLQETELKFSADGTNATPFTPSANFTTTAQTINGETYIKVTPNVGITLSKLGATPIGGTIPVTAGDRYRFRVKGYSNSAKVANLYVKGNSSDIVWFGANLPTSSVGEMWVENSFTIPAGVTQITLGVLYSVAGPSVSTDYFYINEVELTKLTTTTPEYQYNLKDHLGNNRLTFTTKRESDSALATLETANAAEEQSQFIYYDEAVKINSPLFDHTNSGATHYATRLIGGTTNEKYGLAKSLSVMPGDTLNIEVYAKYLDTNSSNWTTALNNFIVAIANGTAPPGTLVDGGASGSIGTQTFPYIGTLTRSNDNGTGPKAYLNYLLFDRNFVYKTGGFQRISSTPRETGNDVAHERLAFDNLVITEPGYIYIYLSNENPTNVEVYFDDFEVEHIKSPVIQTDDYYPFGLTFNSYSRENSTPNDYKYNGKEEQTELELGWLDYGARMYMPEIARWGVVDPLASKFYSWSPYNYVFNNPVNFIDPDGRSGIATMDEKNKTITISSHFVFYGSKATGELAKKSAANMQKMFNAANATVKIDGVEYKVNFKVTAEAVSEDKASEMAGKNTSAENNFIRVEDSNGLTGIESNRSNMEVGGNAGHWVTTDKLGESTTDTHEAGHGYGLGHSARDQRGKGQPDIMSARGTLVDPQYQYDPSAAPGAKGGTLNPEKRAVTQGNVQNMFSGVKFKGGTANVGSATNTIYDKAGNPVLKK